MDISVFSNWFLQINFNQKNQGEIQSQKRW
jgi:hypothetical protein